MFVNNSLYVCYKCFMKPTTQKYPKPLSMRIGDELREALEKEAEREERPVGMMARLLIKEALEARRKKRKG